MWSCLLDFVKKIFHFKSSLPIIFLLLGGGLLVWCIFFPFDNIAPKWYNFALKLGEILLVSSLLSFLTSTVEYLGVFRDALTDVIYDNKFLRNRRDLEDIWLNVSKALFKSKFPNINNSLLGTIKKNYLPEDEICYYNEYRNISDIKYDTNDRDYIIVRNDISFTLKVVDKTKFTFPMNNWICTEEQNKDKVEFQFISVKVNGVAVQVKPKKQVFENNQILFENEIELKGCTEYKIEQVIHKKYLLKDDNYIGFKAKWLVNNMNVQLFHPKEMDVLFVDRGTSEKFNLVKKREGYLEYEYKGLILRKQGYIMILNSNL